MHAAKSPEDCVAHRHSIEERVLLLSGMVLPVRLSAEISVLSSTVAWYNGYCSCFLSSSFFASYGAGGVHCSYHNYSNCSGGSGYRPKCLSNASLTAAVIMACREADCSGEKPGIMTGIMANGLLKGSLRDLV